MISIQVVDDACVRLGLVGSISVTMIRNACPMSPNPANRDPLERLEISLYLKTISIQVCWLCL